MPNNKPAVSPFSSEAQVEKDSRLRRVRAVNRGIPREERISLRQIAAYPAARKER
jgi:hypothetical protein